VKHSLTSETALLWSCVADPRSLSELLTHLKPLVDASMMGMMQLRQEGLLNIIHIPMDMRKPSTEGRRMRAVGHSAELVEWVYYGYLVCPLEMNKPIAVDALRPVLNFEFVHSLNAGDVRADPAA